MELLDKELAKYLKESPGAQRVMDSVKEKYGSFGRISGTVKLELTKDEADLLNGLLKGHLSEGEEFRLSLSKFIKSFEGTRFEGADFLNVCEIYFGYPLESKKEQIHEAFDRKQEFFARIKNRYNNTGIGRWMEALEQGLPVAALEYVNSLYRKDEEGLTILIGQLSKVEVSLALGTRFSLPILAAEATKDPHALDRDRDLYKLLIAYLAFKEGLKYPENQLKAVSLLARAGIGTDIGMRTILTYGFKAKAEDESKGWESFWKNGEPLTLTMKNLAGLKGIVPISPDAIPIAFENPSVFDFFTEKSPEGAYICTSGQLTVLDLLFIDLLLKKPGQKLYYNGDYDPEGLLIADKLWGLYPEGVELIGYEKDLYLKSLSAKEISRKRLRQLKNLKNPTLQMLAQEMEKCQKAGYQEYVIDDLLGCWESALGCNRYLVKG